ncbi:selenium binding protein [Levilactobacillus brevis]|uniref:selenium binding protein n=1 Tax=Levilactobacillus brevis TaxID=1580 RepID=UPI003EB853A9
MYENYTRQSLPDDDYRELLGSAISVFNSNNAFIIENILKISGDQHNWWELIDRTSGNILHKVMQEQYSNIIPENIISLFSELVEQRDRIIHSFQITGPEPNPNQEQLLATKVRGSGEQFIIKRKHLLNFIQKNQELSDLLYDFRKHLN